MCRCTVNMWKKKIDSKNSIEYGVIMTSLNWGLQSFI